MKYLILTLITGAFFNAAGQTQCSISIQGDTCTNQLLTAITSSGDLTTLNWRKDSVLMMVRNNRSFAGEASTIMGSRGKGSDANQFNFPNRICIDKKGNFYIADYNNNRIQKFSPGDSVCTTVLSDLAGPIGLAVDDSGNIYVAEKYAHRITKWAPKKPMSITVAINLGDLTDLFVDKKGIIYSSESDNGVKKWIPNNPIPVVVTTVQALCVYTDSFENVYVGGDGRISKWTYPDYQGGSILGKGIGYSDPTAREFGVVHDLLVDSSGNVFFLDEHQRIQRWDDGASYAVTIAGGCGSGSANNQLQARSFIFDKRGVLYVADANNDRIQQFLPSRTVYPTYMPSLAGEYYVEAKIKKGCNVASKAVSINRPPNNVWSIIGPTVDLCDKSNLVYYTQSDVVPETFEWSFPTGCSIVSGQGTSQVAINTEPGFTSGTVLVHSFNGCGRSLYASLFISGVPLDPIKITGPADVNEYQEGLVYSIQNPVEGVNYTWTVPADATLISGQGTSSIVVNWGKITPDFVTARASNDCGTGDDDKLRVRAHPVSPKSESSLQVRNSVPTQFSITPNPVGNIANVYFNAEKVGVYNISIIDITGKMLMQSRGMTVDGQNLVRLDVSWLAKGVYFIVLSTNSRNIMNIPFFKG